jgi:hypothetical protein
MWRVLKNESSLPTTTTISSSSSSSNRVGGETLVRMQVYLRSHAVSTICYFHPNPPPTDTNSDHDDESSKQTDDGVEESLVGWFANQNWKSLYIVQDVHAIENSKRYLRIHLALAKIFATSVRQDSVMDRWIPLAKPGAKHQCASYGKKTIAETDDQQQQQLKAWCTRCKSVACYCSVQCQKNHWKPARKGGGGHRDSCRDVSEFDIARRLVHVSIASGLITTEHNVLQVLAQIGHLFDHILFDPNAGGAPCFCPHSLRHSCGALCGLSNLLWDVGREHHAVVGFCRNDEDFKIRGENYVASFFPACHQASAG